MWFMVAKDLVVSASGGDLVVKVVADSMSTTSTFEGECLVDNFPPPGTVCRIGRTLKWNKLTPIGAPRWSYLLGSQVILLKPLGSPPSVVDKVSAVQQRPAEPACTCPMLQVLGSGHSAGCPYKKWHREQHPDRMFVD